MARRKQAMVMSIEDQQMVLLHSDGTWQSAHISPGVQVGDIVRLPSGVWGRSFGSLVAAVLVIVLLAAGAVVLPARQAMACVSVDGIPGVELVTNGRGTVLDSQAVSSDGELLLTGLTVKGKKLDDAVEQLLTKARAEGLSGASSGMVLVTVSPVNEEISDRVLRKVHDQAAAGVLATLPADAEVPQIEQIVISQDLQSAAEALGLCPGQYALALLASQAGASISLDEIAAQNVVQQLQAQGLNPGQLIKQLQQEVDLEQLLNENRDKIAGRGNASSGQPGSGQSKGDGQGETNHQGGNSGQGKPGNGKGQDEVDDASSSGQSDGNGRGADGNQGKANGQSKAADGGK